MNRMSLKFVTVLFAVLLLSACSGNKTKDADSQNRAQVEDRSMNRDGASMGDGSDEGDNGVVTQGLDDDPSYNAARLDDPNGPLAVRIIYFDYDSANIRADFADTVAAHAAYLTNNPGTQVTLEGHADERGSREYNLALGERRALAVRRQLVLLGANAGQVEAVSYGEERPVTDCHSEESYALNRRVEILY